MKMHWFYGVLLDLLQMRAFGSVSSATIEVVSLCSAFVGSLFAVVFWGSEDTSFSNLVKRFTIKRA